MEIQSRGLAIEDVAAPSARSEIDHLLPFSVVALTVGFQSLYPESLRGRDGRRQAVILVNAPRLVTVDYTEIPGLQEENR
jgi:hypothetical protein